MQWAAAQFPTVGRDGLRQRTGHSCNNVGLFKMGDKVLAVDGPNGREMAAVGVWGMCHIGSGHFLCLLLGEGEEIGTIAGEVAAAGDWGFDGVDGWINRFPDFIDRLVAIRERFPGKMIVLPNGGGPDREAARRVLDMRLNSGPA